MSAPPWCSTHRPRQSQCSHCRTPAPSVADVRVLAAVSLGGAGHLNPLMPFLEVGRRRGDDVLVVGPAALSDLVSASGLPFVAGGEPDELEVAPIRERLPSAAPAEASVLGNRELFGRLVARALLPMMTEVCDRWKPDLVLRDPCEHASAAAASQLGLRTAQAAISVAEAEWASIGVAARLLDLRHRPRPHVHRRRRLPNGTSSDPRTGGSCLLTVGHRFDPAVLDPLPAGVHAERWVDQAQVLPAAELALLSS